MESVRIWDTDHICELIVEPYTKGVVRFLELTTYDPNKEHDVSVLLSEYGARNLRLAIQKWERENK